MSEQKDWINKMADAEDECPSVSVGGLAHDVGFPVGTEQKAGGISHVEVLSAHYIGHDTHGQISSARIRYNGTSDPEELESLLSRLIARIDSGRTELATLKAEIERLMYDHSDNIMHTISCRGCLAEIQDEQKYAEMIHKEDCRIMKLLHTIGGDNGKD